MAEPAATRPIVSVMATTLPAVTLLATRSPDAYTSVLLGRVKLAVGLAT
jgi:hypothetical protein